MCVWGGGGDGKVQNIGWRGGKVQNIGGAGASGGGGANVLLAVN